MGKYSNPQYLTLNGFCRSKDRPTLPSNYDLWKEQIADKIAKEEGSIKMTPMRRHILKKRGIALRKQQPKQKTISPEAAYALAMALKGMLNT